MKNKVIKILFVGSIILLLIPSMLYIINNKTVYKFSNYYTYTLTDTFTKNQEGFIYLVIILLVSLLYILIIKNQDKIFKNIKQMMIYIFIVTILFVFIIPSTSSDVFYYLGVGRIQNEYHVNPYYTSINEVIEANELAKQDEIIQNTPEIWRGITVVYGPVWTILCNLLTLISFNSVNWSLLVFKIFNLIIHLLNCYMIYKITKKKMYVVIYGLNPLVLIETIANAHNDILTVFLVLVSIYFLIKKKNILLSVVFLSISAGIKYFTTMLLPFILIYYFRKEKLSKRIYKCIKYGIIFLGILILFYLIYAKDLFILNGLSAQQGKLAKSIPLCIYYLTHTQCPELLNYIQAVIFILFAFICIINVLVELLEKNVKFYKVVRRYNLMLLIFTFVVLTTFQPWYVVWFFPTLMWQKPRMQKVLIYMTVMTCLINSVFIFKSEAPIYGTAFVALMLISWIGCMALNSKITSKGDNIIGKRKISFNRWK